MQIQTLESSLDNELLEGEEVLWSGRPDPRRRRIVFPTRPFFILGLVFMPVGLFIVLVGLVLLLISVFPPEARLSSLGVFIPGGVFFLLGIIYFLIGIAGFSPPRNVLYAITNRRVIMLRPGRYLRALSYGKGAITQIQRFERPDGSGDLVFASTPAYSSAGRNQSNATFSSAVRPGVFSALPNVRQVEQILNSMLNEE